MLQNIISITAAIESGDKQRAQRLLRPLLETSPSADLWYLAAQASETPQEEKKCLERALALDPMHGRTKSRLIALREGQTSPVPEVIKSPKPQVPPLVPPPAEMPKSKPVDSKNLQPEPDALPVRRVKQSRKRSPWRAVGCLGFIILSLASSFFMMSVLGMGFAGQILGFVTGVQPVTELNGVPIEDVAHAPLLVPANRSVPLENGQQQVDILYAGYAHEFAISATQGHELTIYVQFISPAAKNVSSNVVVVDPSGEDAESHCVRGGILSDNSGVTFICQIYQGGHWKVRIFGREGESSGAYYISTQQLLF